MKKTSHISITDLFFLAFAAIGLYAGMALKNWTIFVAVVGGYITGLIYTYFSKKS